MSKIEIGDNLRDTIETFIILGAIVAVVIIISLSNQTSENKKQEVKQDSTIVNKK